MERRRKKYCGSVLFIVACSLVADAWCRRQALEDVTRKQFDALVQDEDYVAVFWYGKNCKTCDRVASVLETKGSDLEEFGIKVVKSGDKKLAKQSGVLNFPGLSFIKSGGKAKNFEGDLGDGEAIVDFLASDEALNMPDRIEEVQAKHLERLIAEKLFIAVLFYNVQDHSKEVLLRLEKIDDNADKLGIAFVKINDLELVDEYGLTGLPSLVYYRHAAPIIYEGDLMNEEAILEWLIHNRSTGDEEDVIEDIAAESLEAMVNSVENLAVLFYNSAARKSDSLLESLEKIDDDCDAKGIHFVKVKDVDAGKPYGITQLPKLVFFKNELPNIFDDDRDEPRSEALLVLLETIDDELDKHEVNLVKVSDDKAANEYGISQQPAIVYFENGIPSLFSEPYDSARDILDWLVEQVEGDEIEDVTDEMLNKMIRGEQGGTGAIFSSHNDVGVLFYEEFGSKFTRASPISSFALTCFDASNDDYEEAL